MNHLAKSRWFIWQMNHLEVVHFKSRWLIFRPYNRDTSSLQNLTNYHGITSHYQVLFKQHCWLQKLFSGIFSYDVVIPQDGWKRPRPRQLVRSRRASLSLQTSNACLFNLHQWLGSRFLGWLKPAKARVYRWPSCVRTLSNNSLRHRSLDVNHAPTQGF